jgi:hypothetical protein
MRAHSDLKAILDNLKTPKPEQSTVPPYRCQNTNFGSYLIVANLLHYEGAEFAANGKDVDLLFCDPQARGPDLLRRFNAGVAEPVNARVLYEVRGYLLSEVKRVQAGVDRGKH